MGAVFETKPGGELPVDLRQPDPDKRIALYLHGGAFLRDEAADVYAERLADALQRPVLMPHYRIGRENPYPAASDDAIAAYRSLLSAGWGPDRVLIVGHSAGGTLALSIVMRADDYGLPKPAGVVCLSGVLDFKLGQQSLIDNEGKDTINGEQAKEVCPMYAGGTDPNNPGLSPAAAPISAWIGAPPLFVLCGGHEILRDDTFAVARAAACAGCEVEMRIVASGQHGCAQRLQPLSDRLLIEISAFAKRCDDPLSGKQQWIRPSLGDAGHLWQASERLSPHR